MDALALTADEGRGQQRYAPGSCKQAVIRRCPNGATYPEKVGVSSGESNSPRKASGGTETSHYPEEKKETSIPLVAASERGTAQTQSVPKTAVVAPWE